MKIAVLADIHSNAEALSAVIADAESQQVDGFVVAGDIVIDGPDSCEALDIVKGLRCPVIKGNREGYLLRYHSGCLPDWDGSNQMASPIWTYRCLRPGDMKYIAGLPEQAVVGLSSDSSARIVHGSPFSISELLKPNEDMDAVKRAALAVNERVLIFGHNHMQWTEIVHGRLLLDPGSVGVHFNHECKAEYGILSCCGGAISAELRRVSYDFEALEQRLVSSGLMAAAPVWTKLTFEGVKAGRNYCLQFLSEAKSATGSVSGLIPNDIWDKVARKWWDKMRWGAFPA